MCIRSKKEEQATFAMCCVCNRESPLGGSIKKKKSLKGMGRTQLLKVERQNLDVKISKENMYFSMWNE